MSKKDLETEVAKLQETVEEVGRLAKLALKYHKIGPGYIEEILEKLAVHLPEDDRDHRVEPYLHPGKEMNQPKLSVFFDSMPESNGKRNWTVMVHRKEGDVFESITVERTEYYDRARYEADSWRYMLGMIEERPNLLDYDPDLLCPPGHELESWGADKPDKLKFRCSSCGHEQMVYVIYSGTDRYFSSGANWCDACEKGKPEIVEEDVRFLKAAESFWSGKRQSRPVHQCCMGYHHG